MRDEVRSYEKLPAARGRVTPKWTERRRLVIECSDITRPA